VRYFAWYDNGTGYFDAVGWIEADSAEEAAKAEYEDGWKTPIRITASSDARSPVLAEYPSE